jgi:hypothetical protein
MTADFRAKPAMLPASDSGPGSSWNSTASYRHVAIHVREAFEFVMAGRWDLPDFQRPFVWRPAQVSALADSLWRGYPIGYLLIWESARISGPAWIADGQQRLTSLCLLFGAQPPWWSRRRVDERNRRRGFELFFDVEAFGPPLFLCASSGKVRESAGPLIPVSEILAHDPLTKSGKPALQMLAAAIKRRGICRSMSEDQVYGALHRVAMIQHLPLGATSLRDCDLDDVIEVFQRLNSRGTRFRRLLLNFAMRSLVAASRSSFG